MHRAGRLVAECLDAINDIVAPGVPTQVIDDFVYDFAIAHGALPATLGYKGYTKSTCTSINHVVCHGIPGDKPLRDGDIVNIDVTLIVDGWHGDSSRMYKVGNVKRAAERLVDVTYEAMMRGIEVDPARPHHRRHRPRHPGLCRARALQRRARLLRPRRRPALPRRAQHPPLRHAPAKASTLKPGMIFTVEPMINLGRPQVKILADGWTAVTRDRSLSAQFEHSVGVTETGYEIFTLSPKGLTPPRRRSMTGFDDKAGDVPHYHDHRERLRERFHEIGGAEPPRLRAARADPVPGDPADRHQADRQGSCCRNSAASARCSPRPPARLMEVDGIGEKAAHHLKVIYAAAQRFLKEPVKQRPLLDSWSVGDRLLPRRDGASRRSSSSASSSSTSGTP